MVDAINTVTKSIDEADLSQTQYLQKVRETNREIEKSARDAISNLNSEAEFYKDILAYEELYDDNGNLNDAGKATMQLSIHLYFQLIIVKIPIQTVTKRKNKRKKPLKLLINLPI